MESKPTTGQPAGESQTAGLSADELSAMKDYLQEKKTVAKRGSGVTREDGEKDVLAKIAELPEADRTMASRLHALVKETVPELWPRLWYGMPAYALEGKVICFYQSAQKFKTRYSTLGFSDAAKLDEGAMWPSAYALMALSPQVEQKIVELLKRAAK